MIDYTKITNTINQKKADISASYDVAEAKGATIPTNKNLENLPSTLETITGGGGASITMRKLTVTENGTYFPSENEAFNEVDVLIAPPPGEKNNVTIIENPQAPVQTSAGNTLGDIVISGGVAMFSEWQVFGTFTWDNPLEIVNTTSVYSATFTPLDTENFNTAKVNITVTVAYTPPISSGILQVTREVGISDPEWTKVGDNALLEANANKLSSVPSEFIPAVDDYFGNPDVPVYGKIQICNVSDETNEIVSYLGDPDFRWDGSNNTSVYTYYPSFYFRRRRNGNAEEIAVSEEPLTGGILVEEFLIATFSTRLETITLSDSTTKEVYRSYIGAAPTNYYSQSNLTTPRQTIRTTVSENASMGDWRMIVIGMLHIIKYGTNNIQGEIGNGRGNSSSGLTGVGDAHTILMGRDGYVGSETSTTTWSLGIADFYGFKGTIIDGITDTKVDNKVLFASDPTKFVEIPTEETEGYSVLGYDISYDDNQYITETGIDQSNENGYAQVIPFRVKDDPNATSSTGTTDGWRWNSNTGYRHPVYAGVGSTYQRGVFSFAFFYGSGYGGSVRVVRPKTL